MVIISFRLRDGNAEFLACCNEGVALNDANGLTLVSLFSGGEALVLAVADESSSGGSFFAVAK